MPREVTIEIKREVKPTLFDYLLGTLWYWTVSRFERGFAYTEKQARRRAEKTADRMMKGTIEYQYGYGYSPEEDS